MRALVTGISGFVGAGLARYLVNQGVEVHGLVRESSNLWRLKDIQDRLTLHQGDLLDDARVNEIFQLVKPDTVFHLAVYGAYPSQKDVGNILSTSIRGTLTLLNASKDVNVGLFLNAGSSSEYGTKDHPMCEDEYIEPNSYYAVGKATQSHLCQHFSRQEGLPTVTLRLFSVYGPFEEPGRLVPTVIFNALNAQPVTISDPKVARDFIYIDDVAEGFYRVSARPDLSGEIINLGTGKQSTLGDMANVILSASGASVPYTVGGNEKRSFDTYTWVSNPEKMSRLLEWTPKHSLEEGVAKTVEWLKKNVDYYRK